MNRIRMIKIPEQEYRELKRLKSMIDVDLYNQLVRSLDDIKHGRVKQLR